ncbi:hypothetical protein [Kaistella yonginensis]|uniref:hypothetical protein n=1 Tax=Kaistella yonginensis TaxID=658267 RepID=UPI0025B36400|nr:hypothetical protein [Kaistella yonginensis]MDN3606362.1 hypothetical protein [Kaistella yonginensis]
MNTNLFKNFKSLKEKADEIKDDETVKEDNVSVKIENHTEKLVVEQVSKVKSNDVAESSKIVKKNRPVKKEILDAKSLLQSQVGEEKKNIYAKTMDEDLAKRTFTIFLKADSLEFIKNLVFYKATVERQIFYNQSEALVEALELLKNNFKNIKPRPEFIRDQEKTKKGGRKRNSDEIYDTTTTVYIPGQYFEFIKDVTYNKVVEGDLYYKDWDLLELGIIELKKKYGKNIQPRPDYIREDEKQRGRKAKVNS